MNMFIIAVSSPFQHIETGCPAANNQKKENAIYYVALKVSHPLQGAHKNGIKRKNIQALLGVKSTIIESITIERDKDGFPSLSIRVRP